MLEKIGTIAKAGALFFVIGALLSLAAPALGVIAGISPTMAGAGAALGHTANPLWMGAFFGAFGAFDAAIRPGFDGLFEKILKKNPSADKDRQAPCGCAMEMMPAADMAQQSDLAQSKYREQVAVERLSVTAEKSLNI